MKSIIRTWFLPALAALLVFGAALLPTLAEGAVFLLLPCVFLAASALAFSVASSETPVIAVAISVGATLLMCFFFGSVFTGLLAAALYLPVGFGVGLAFAKKEAINAAAMTAVILALVLLLGTLVAFIYETTETFDPATAMDHIKDDVRPVMDSIYDLFNELDSDLLSRYHYDEILKLGKDGFAEQMMTAVTVSIVSSLPTVILTFTALCYFAVKHLLLRRGVSVTASDFENVRIGKPTAILYLAVLIVYLIASFFAAPDSVFFVLITVISNAFGCVTFFGGLSLIYHIVHVVRERSSVRSRLTVAAVIVLSLLINFLFVLVSVFGLYDAMTDIRNRMGGGKI